MRRFFFFQNILQNREALVTKRHLVVWWCILLLFSNRSLFLCMSRIAIAECQRNDWKILQFLPFYQELPLHIWKKKNHPAHAEVTCLLRLPILHTLLCVAAPDSTFETLHSHIRESAHWHPRKQQLIFFFLALEPHSLPTNNLKFLNYTIS